MPNRLTDATAEDDVSRSTEAILGALLGSEGNRSTGALLGSEAPALRGRRLRIATKANPWAEWDESLDAARVRLQLETSLAALRRCSVDLFYLHAPDHNTPIRETLRAVDGARCSYLYSAPASARSHPAPAAGQLCTERASCGSSA